MAGSIEHREIGSILDAYGFMELPNFLILHGQEPRVQYAGGDLTEGTQKLDEYLQMIQNSNTGSVYALRVYPSDVTNITNKTPYKGSTRFLLNAMVPTTTDDKGNTVVLYDRGRGAAPVATIPADITNRLNSLETENKKLQGQLQDERINNLRQEFKAQIAGLNQPEEKNTWDKIGDIIDKLIEKPEAIEKLGSAIRGIFRPQTNYINNPAGGGMAGTHQTSNMEPEETVDEAIAGTVMVNPFLSVEERKLKKKEQAPLMIERLGNLNDEQHEDTQNTCLESIEARIGAVTLTRMLVAVACLDDDDMNKLLNNLD